MPSRVRPKFNMSCDHEKPLTLREPRTFAENSLALKFHLRSASAIYPSSSLCFSRFSPAGRLRNLFVPHALPASASARPPQATQALTRVLLPLRLKTPKHCRFLNGTSIPVLLDLIHPQPEFLNARATLLPRERQASGKKNIAGQPARSLFRVLLFLQPGAHPSGSGTCFCRQKAQCRSIVYRSTETARERHSHRAVWSINSNATVSCPNPSKASG